MAVPKCLATPKNNQDNEFYTLYETVEYVFDNTKGLKEYVKGKILYLPCDTKNSNIFKYLNNNKEKLQIKDILITSDDYYQHHDLYKKADIVITNPPFTKISKWILFLYELNKEFIIWAPFTLYTYPCISKYVINNLFKPISSGKKLCIFQRPDGTMKHATDISIFSNIPKLNITNKFFQIHKQNTMEYLIANNKLSFYNNIPILHNLKDFPINYYEKIYVSAAAIYRYQNMFDIFDFKCFRNEPNKPNKITGKQFYRKDCYLVKLKDYII